MAEAAKAGAALKPREAIDAGKVLAKWQERLGEKGAHTITSSPAALAFARGAPWRGRHRSGLTRARSPVCRSQPTRL